MDGVTLPLLNDSMLTFNISDLISTFDVIRRNNSIMNIVVSVFIHPKTLYFTKFTGAYVQ